MLAALSIAVHAFSVPHANVVHATSALMASSIAPIGINGFALAFAGLCLLQSSAPIYATAGGGAPRAPVGGHPQVPPFPMPIPGVVVDKTSDTEEHVCYPVDMEDCETCEYNDEWSEYYNEPVWLCANGVLMSSSDSA